MRWARPLGPRRLRGTNPRARGTDLRSRLASPRALSWPTNPRFQAAAYELVRTPPAAATAPEPPRAHRKSRPLLAVPYGCVTDSAWRRRAVATSGPCARCGDDGFFEVPEGAIRCEERVTPGLDYCDELAGDEPP